ncbi:DUF3951 domain-containing protein [Heyndrickxia oleronia]|uniref:DUF3951 domain-containing protein n=1 Tax=Heyndrickxia oleronia TaxID=38875 RepID=A0AAW6SYB5_9BACI|nr:DUF3951 domain-containing protein [Heyndrickxia oleronia]MCM3236183.1 DUF3951 domain-containing protein [Heyndrickxia oleronia]MDH5162435.1 DUF3951 domain-containing protein [Heyndrickxia oleronia]
MIFLTSLSILFTVMIVFLIGFIIFKIIKNRMLPNNSYTPFDYITAQSTVEFHEEKEETIEEVKSGDKNSK